MDWLNKFTSLLKKGGVSQEYFLALILKEKSIKAVVWQEKEGAVAIIDTAMVPCEKNLEALSDDELLACADQAIGLSEKTLSQTIKTSKTIFGLPDWWVENTNIKDAYLGKIKKICKELILTPLGFVVVPEAISHLLKIEEGTPPTILLVFIGQATLGVTLVRSGRIEKSKTVAKEGKSDSEIVAEIIKSFEGVEVLPSRMLLFDGQVSLEETKQEFLAFPWTKELPFLHFPKIDIVPEDADSKAVVSGAAKEMGFAFEEEGQSTLGEQEGEATPPQTAPPAIVKEEGDDEEGIQGEEGEEKTFGFVKDHDVAEVTLAREARLEDEDEDEEPVKSSPAPPSLSLPSFSFSLPKINVRLVFGLFDQLLSLRLWFFASIGAGILIVLLALFIFLPGATVVLIPQTRTLENDVEITVNTKATSIDKEKKQVPATVLEIKQEDEKSKSASGKKLVGDLARGELTIYNKTENRKVFPKGTIVVGPSDLRFTFDDEVTVASTSAFELTPSSIKAKVTAAQIGEEGNLPANSNFPFKDFPTSSYFARSESALSGGTKREVTVVSKDDQESLLKDLLEELRTKAKEELSRQREANRIVDSALKEEIVSKDFSKRIDEEANTVSLKLSVSFSTLAYKEGDLLELLGNALEKAVPQGFSFTPDRFETTVKTAGKEKLGVIPLTVHYKATLIPELDGEDIKRAIAGKSKSAVEVYLKSLPLEDFSIQEAFAMPAPLDLLPQRVENIKVAITTK